MMRCCYTLCLAAVLLAGVDAAAVPTTIAFQGELATGDGAPFDGAVSVRTALYADAEGGEPVWGPVEHGTVRVSRGRLELLLGDESDPIDAGVVVPEGMWLCQANEVAQWNGTAWVCASLATACAGCQGGGPPLSLKCPWFGPYFYSDPCALPACPPGSTDLGVGCASLDIERNYSNIRIRGYCERLCTYGAWFSLKCAFNTTSVNQVDCDTPACPAGTTEIIEQCVFTGYDCRDTGADCVNTGYCERLCAL